MKVPEYDPTPGQSRWVNLLSIQLRRCLLNHTSEALTDVAYTMVELRREYGDMGGRTAAYRRALLEAYDLTGQPPGDWARIQAGSRYHVNRILGGQS